MSTNFQNSFTSGLSSKFVIKLQLRSTTSQIHHYINLWNLTVQQEGKLP